MQQYFYMHTDHFLCTHVNKHVCELDDHVFSQTNQRTGNKLRHLNEEDTNHSASFNQRVITRCELVTVRTVMDKNPNPMYLFYV